ncbi:hypothetical protein BD413DRAFT_637664 [Trametes elegans]|nr:hypothetical protein BD413DRAFT_637664 [Trametes elegans]
MASQGVTTTIEVYESLYTDNRCLVAVVVLIVYEYIITFDQEVELFWRPKMTGATALFLSNRYLPLLSYILVMCEYIPMTDSVEWLTPFFSCVAMVRTQSVVHFLLYVPWAAFSALRAFALNGQSWPLALLIFVLSMISVGVNFAQFGLGIGSTYDMTFGCLVQVSLTVTQARATPDNLLAVSLLSRLSLILADILVIGITWHTMRRRLVLQGEITRRPLTLSTVLIRDGTVLLILNILHLTFVMLSLTIAFDPSSQISTFTEPVTVVLVSRFLLDLQAANRRALRLDSRDPLHVDVSSAGTLSFARVVGSLGASLGPSATVTDWRADCDVDVEEEEEDGGSLTFARAEKREEGEEAVVRGQLETDAARVASAA